MGTAAGRTEENWAVTEFAEAELGDARRTQRVIRMATVLAQQPRAGLPEACGSPAALKATYRLLDNEAVAPAELLAESCERDVRAGGAGAGGVGGARYDGGGLDGASGHDGAGADGQSHASGVDGAYDAGVYAGAGAAGIVSPRRVGAGSRRRWASGRRASSGRLRRKRVGSGCGAWRR